MSGQVRDQYGRPLRGSLEGAVPGVPERTEITSELAWSEALEYLAADRPFHAHEVFEQRWRCCPDEERAVWQTLAQWAAALTHLARGNRTGAVSIAQSALANLDAVQNMSAVVDLATVRTSLATLLHAA
ncbi:MAG: DUF309 domain-containing protein [Candidatus Nanopelagicales bacterium]